MIPGSSPFQTSKCGVKLNFENCSERRKHVQIVMLLHHRNIEKSMWLEHLELSFHLPTFPGFTAVSPLRWKDLRLRLPVYHEVSSRTLSTWTPESKPSSTEIPVAIFCWHKFSTGSTGLGSGNNDVTDRKTQSESGCTSSHTLSVEED